MAAGVVVLVIVVLVLVLVLALINKQRHKVVIAGEHVTISSI